MNRTQRMVLALMLAVPFLPALLAYPGRPSTARAAQQSEDSVCPLTDDQTEKSIRAFDKIANVFTKEPRCVNCHGAVDPFGADANRTHGGGPIDRIMKTERNEISGELDTTVDLAATVQQCQSCHSAFSEGWTTPPAAFFFVGKDALTLCKFERDFFSEASDFINHIERDPLILEAFTGRMGLNDDGRRLMLPPYVFARRSVPYPATPTGVTHRALIQMARDWVDAQGGRFQGNQECGCKRPDGISGTYEWVSDGVDNNGLIKNYSRHAATISLLPQADGTLKGSAQFSFVMTNTQRDPTRGCLAVNVAGEPMIWSVQFEGLARRDADGSLKITMRPTSESQPMYRYQWRNECENQSGVETAQVPVWPWTEVTLKDGAFDVESSPPLGAGEFGAPGRGSGMKMHLEQKRPQAR